MIEFGGIIYYIDLDALEKTITPSGVSPKDKIKTTERTEYFNELNEYTGSEVHESVNFRGKEIDMAKYEIVRNLIDFILDYDEDEIDATLGVDRVLEKTPLSFKIAFNTLYHYEILKEKE